MFGKIGINMDRRQRKTRQAIYDAFTTLLEKKNYSNITVQDIIDEADVGRSTFYSHFETKDELLKSLCTEIFNHVFSEKLVKESTHDFTETVRWWMQHEEYSPEEISGFFFGTTLS